MKRRNLNLRQYIQNIKKKINCTGKKKDIEINQLKLSSPIKMEKFKNDIITCWPSLWNKRLSDSLLMKTNLVLFSRWQFCNSLK